MKELKKVKFVKSDNLKEILSLRNLLISNIPKYLRKKATKKYLEKRIKNKKGFIIKLILKNKVIGFQIWFEKNKVAYLWWGVIDKKYQGNHLGFKLIKRTLNDIKKRKIKRIWTKIKNDNFIALRLFLKFHFSIQKVYKENGISITILEKKLNS
jgi:ribosomal protein S18 acetylase RimI-like enzyme